MGTQKNNEYTESGDIDAVNHHKTSFLVDYVYFFFHGLQ